jgi:hypothetical protein
MSEEAQAAQAGAVEMISKQAGDLGAALAIWHARDDSGPCPAARRAANDAMDAIDAMLRELHALRSRLVSEIRASDDATRPALTLCSVRPAKGHRDQAPPRPRRDRAVHRPSDTRGAQHRRRRAPGRAGHRSPQRARAARSCGGRGLPRWPQMGTQETPAPRPATGTNAPQGLPEAACGPGRNARGHAAAGWLRPGRERAGHRAPRGRQGPAACRPLSGAHPLRRPS